MARRLLTTILVAAGALLLPGPAAHAEDFAERVYRGSLVADDRVSYVGAKVLTDYGRRRNRESRVRISHRASPLATRIEVYDDDGRRRFESLEVGNDSYMRRGDDDWSRSGFPESPPRIELVLKNYRPTLKGHEEVAGRSCLMIKLDPVHAGNPFQVLWIDKRSKLVLRRKVYDSRGEVDLDSRFEEIDFNPRFGDDSFRPPARFTIPTRRETQPDFTVLDPAPGSLPPGYEFASQSAWRSGRGPVVVGRRFTNGLNTLSLIQSAAPLQRNGPAGLQRQVGRIHVVLYGDIDPAQSQKMLDGLRPLN